MVAHNYTPSGQGKDYDYSQDHCFVKLSSHETKGELCMVEDTLKPGFQLGRHHHKVMTEVFYMLEGELTMTLDEEIIILRTGDTLTVPPNVWHAADCKEGGKMLTIFKNGQFDLFLEKLSQMSEEEFQDSTKMRTLSQEFDIYEE